MTTIAVATRRRVAAMAAAVIAIVLAAAFAPTATNAADPTSSFYFAGEGNDPWARGNAAYLQSPAATFDPSGGYTLEVRTDDEWWRITATGPNDAQLVAGTTYTDTKDGGHPTAARFDVSWEGYALQCGGTHYGEFVVHDVAYDGDEVTLLSLTFDLSCDADDYHGEIRFNTAAPSYQGLARSPWNKWPYDLGYLPIGQNGPATTFTFDNVGAGSIDLGSATVTGAHPGDFGIVADACSGATLAAGTSCSLGVRFEPGTAGEREAILRLPTDTALPTRDVRLEGFAQIPTTTTIDGPAGWVDPSIRVKAYVTPYPSEGPHSGSPAVWLEVVGYVPERGEGNPTGYTSLGEAPGEANQPMDLRPGIHQIYAEFNPEFQPTSHGNSRSETIEVKILQPTSIKLTSSADPSDTSAPATFTATLEPTDVDFTAGQLELKDVTTDTVLATLDVSPGDQQIVVTPDLSAGEHLLRATFSGSTGVKPSSAERTQTVRLDAGASIKPTTFYPVVDGYRDELIAQGWRTSGASVALTVRSHPGGEIVHEQSLPVGTDPFVLTWDGTVAVAAGELAPPGEYDAVVEVDDGGEPLTVEERVTLSHDSVLWKTKSVTLKGNAFNLKGKSKNATISKSKSIYANGVRLGSGKGSATVAYSFPVVDGDAYGWLKFEVQGKSPNKHKAIEAIWNPALGGYRLPSNYDAAKFAGPWFKWWKTGVDGTNRVRKGKVRALVAVGKGMGRSGPAAFDIKRVRLTYKVGVIQSAGPAADSALARTLAASSGAGQVGRTAAQRAAVTLPALIDRKDPPTMPSEEAPSTSIEDPTEQSELPVDDGQPPADRSVDPIDPTPPPTAAPEPEPTPTDPPEPKTTDTPKPNVAPVADAGGPYAVDEGDTIRLDARASADPDGAIVGYEWTRAARLDDATSKRPKFEARDDNSLEISLTVTDDDGAQDQATARITVRNVAPRLTKVKTSGGQVAGELVLKASIRDPGIADSHEVEIDWGDGRSSRSGLKPQERDTSMHHTYVEPGSYEVSLLVRDDDGGEDSRSVTVTVLADANPTQTPASDAAPEVDPTP